MPIVRDLRNQFTASLSRELAHTEGQKGAATGFPEKMKPTIRRK